MLVWHTPSLRAAPALTPLVRQAQLTMLQACMFEASAELAHLNGACAAAEQQTRSVGAAASTRQSEVRTTLQGCVPSRAHCRSRVLTHASHTAQLEATVSRLTAELASSREAAEALRRDLHSRQADGEGRDRQHDASTRDLRKELRDCDETIGHVTSARCVPCATRRVLA